MTVGQIEANLVSMAELAKANKIRVVLASILPVSNYGHDRQGNPLDMRINRPPEKILELNAWIKKYAAVNRHTYLDYFLPWSIRKDCCSRISARTDFILTPRAMR